MNLRLYVPGSQGTIWLCRPLLKEKGALDCPKWLKKARDDGKSSSWMLSHVYEGLHWYWDTDEFKALSEQAKKAKGSLKGGSLHTGGAKSVGTISREMEKELGRISFRHEVFKQNSYQEER